jgi:hypothetical protein
MSGLKPTAHKYWSVGVILQCQNSSCFAPYIAQISPASPLVSCLLILYIFFIYIWTALFYWQIAFLVQFIQCTCIRCSSRGCWARFEFTYRNCSPSIDSCYGWWRCGEMQAKQKHFCFLTTSIFYLGILLIPVDSVVPTFSLSLSSVGCTKLSQESCWNCSVGYWWGRSGNFDIWASKRDQWQSGCLPWDFLRKNGNLNSIGPHFYLFCSFLNVLFVCRHQWGGVQPI